MLTCFCVCSLVAEKDSETGALQLSWSSPSRWAEVCIGLVGPQGAMKALTPTLFARTPPRLQQYVEESLDEGSGGEAVDTSEAAGMFQPSAGKACERAESASCLMRI